MVRGLQWGSALLLCRSTPSPEEGALCGCSAIGHSCLGLPRLCRRWNKVETGFSGLKNSNSKWERCVQTWCLCKQIPVALSVEWLLPGLSLCPPPSLCCTVDSHQFLLCLLKWETWYLLLLKRSCPSPLCLYSSHGSCVLLLWVSV